jgi:peptide/nickel transport system ATP-binding protein
MSNQTILQIDKLNVSFINNGIQNTVLHDISFNIEKNQTLGIVGESGSGKSLTALSILQLLPDNATINSGEITYYQQNMPPVQIHKTGEQAMQQLRGSNIAMIFQEPMTSLNPSLTCGYQTSEPLIIHNKLSPKDAQKRVLELFAEVKLPDPAIVFNKYPHQLSGGQRQRVMIAMALSCNPKIIIADEPTTALDVTVQKSILTLLRDLKDIYGMSLLFITHDLNVIAEIADRIVVMQKGQIVEQGEAVQILTQPKNVYTKALLACKPSLNTSKIRLLSVSDFINKEESDISFTPIFDSTDNKAIPDEIPILSLKNVNTYFRNDNSLFSRNINQMQALKDINLEVHRGETVGLVGESGSGKTTLGRTILRLIELSDGNIFFKGKDLSKLNRHELRDIRKNIQIIFQDPYSSLNPKITVGEAIMEPMIVHNLYKNSMERRGKTIDLLLQVGLEPEHFNRYPHEFSGGQRQRIGIARALACQPDLIICDESVSALDVSVQAQVLNLLNDLKAKYHLTYIFISHDLSVVKYMSDHILVLKDGSIIESASTEDLFSCPHSEYTKTLIDSIPHEKKS